MILKPVIMKKVIYGEIFIIPNESTKIISSEDKSRLISLLEITPIQGESFVEVCARERNTNESWCDYRFEFQKKFGMLQENKSEELNYFPKYLPVRTLSGLHEGERLWLYCPLYKGYVCLEAVQSIHNTENKPFEDVLRSIISF